MAVKAADLTSKGQAPDIGALRGEVAQGSSWAALCMCIEARPLDLGELLELTGVDVMKDVRRLRAFDACVDGYTVFHDGRLRNKL